MHPIVFAGFVWLVIGLVVAASAFWMMERECRRKPDHPLAKEYMLDLDDAQSTPEGLPLFVLLIALIWPLLIAAFLHDVLTKRR